jgi:polar amino acid transport system permease protein
MDLTRVWTLANWNRLLFGDYFNGGEWGGLTVTLAIGLLAIPAATLLGAIIGIMRAANAPSLRAIAAVYVHAFRNVPLLILVFWAYFLPPVLGFDLSGFVSVLMAIVLFTGAYIAEIIASGIRGVPDQHIQAGRALGLSALQIQTWIVLPQAYFNMLPAITGRYILAVKNTSLAFLIGLADLTEIGKQINVQLMSAPVAVYLTILMIYFVINALISAALGKLERREVFGRLLPPRLKPREVN